MRQDDQSEQQERRDFFISYTSSDRQWAEWIAMQLEEAGYTFFIQVWDFRPGSNFVAEMDNAAKRAERTLLVLSPAYLESDYAFAEWAAAFRHDPKGTQRRLLPVRILPVEVNGLLGSVVFIDLVQLEEAEARERLLAGIQQDRVKPAAVAFPGHHDPFQSVAFPGSLPPIWNVSFARNPFFTGRDDLLEQLHTQLQTTQAAALSQPQAISGLGGIGKTQLAIEYSYRYRQEYQAVLWARADTTEALNASYTEIARLLQLPQQDAQEQEVIVQAVKGWLRTHQGWLLILDNADELDLVQTFLPTACPGHLLLTTRAQTVGKLARRLEVETLEREVGALMLLRRTGLVPAEASLEAASPSDRAIANALTEELGGLPLALDQAGAYIEETQCSLTDYQHQYQTRRATLLALRGGLKDDHPEPVATTWSLSFAKVEAANPTAAELLRICAFLAPDAIPEELLVEALKISLPLSKPPESSRKKRRCWFSWFRSASHGQQLPPVPSSIEAREMNEALAILRTYSLLTRDPHACTLTIHRLIQVILREHISAEEALQWKQRVVLAVNTVFPNTELEDWYIWERLLPHALICATWIEQEALTTPTIIHLLNHIGCYLDLRGRYPEAGPLLVKALTISEQLLGAQHPSTASSLNNLAELYTSQGKYGEAEPLYLRALAIREQQLGGQHPDTAQSLNNLAGLYRDEGKYGEAEPLYRRALAINEQQLGTQHPETIITLNNLALLFQDLGKYEAAEQLYVYVLQINEQQLRAQHPSTASSLNNLAELYTSQGKYGEAEPLYLRALAIREQQLGAQHPDTAQSLHNLATFYRTQGKYETAEPLYVRALQICEQVLGGQHPNTANCLNSFASLYRKQGKYGEAEPLYLRALAIREQQLGGQHPDTATSLNSLAELYRVQGKYAQAEPLFQRALTIREKKLGREHPDTALSVWWLAALFEQEQNYQEAQQLYERALSTYEQSVGPEHPDTQSIRKQYATLLEKMKGEEDAP